VSSSSSAAAPAVVRSASGLFALAAVGAMAGAVVLVL
jgi:hypothetical protein